MNKGTHFLGQPMYGQLISCSTKRKFFVSVKKTVENATSNTSMLGNTWSLCSMQWSNASTPFAKS